jgi:DNA polymerase-3 subunit delta
MAQRLKPVVYLLFGDDLVAIDGIISDLKSHLGDASSIELNFTNLDGRSLPIEQLETAGRSLPFLAERRLTVVNHPLSMMQNESSRARVLALLETLPQESAVVLAEHKPLLSSKDRRAGKKHWLQKWAEELGGRAYIKECSLPFDAQLSGWILQHARKRGGEFESRAAVSLSDKVAGDVNLAEQEIVKLLTYVNYERPVTEADVETLTALVPEGGIFNFVDALGNRDRNQAINEYHRLLSDNDVQSIFGMIIRQFRLLVQSREIIDQRGGEQEITKLLKVHPFVGGKLADQARHFTQQQLDSIFHRLLEIDSDLKLGKMESDLNIDLLIAEIT